MLWSGDDGLCTFPVPDLEEPGPAPLADDGPGHSVEPPVGHPLVDARFADDMDLLPDLELLDGGHDRGDPPAPYLLLELVACLFPWTVMVCHCLLPLLASLDLEDVELDDPGRPPDEAGKARPGPPAVARYELLHVQACLSDDIKEKCAAFLACHPRIDDPAFPYPVCPPVDHPGRRLLRDHGTLQAIQGLFEFLSGDSALNLNGDPVLFMRLF